MKANQSLQLWGIYYIDREFAREMGDPLRTVVEACSKAAAEEEAARLGFYDAWAHPVTLQQAIKANWLPQRLCRHHVHQHTDGGIRV